MILQVAFLYYEPIKKRHELWFVSFSLLFAPNAGLSHSYILFTCRCSQNRAKRSWQADLSDVPRTQAIWHSAIGLTELMHGSVASRRVKSLSMILRRELTKTRSVEAERIEARKAIMF